jgi:hypothetical protein
MSLCEDKIILIWVLNALYPADSVVALVFVKTWHELDRSLSTCSIDFVAENPWIL